MALAKISLHCILKEYALYEKCFLFHLKAGFVPDILKFYISNFLYFFPCRSLQEELIEDNF